MRSMSNDSSSSDLAALEWKCRLNTQIIFLFFFSIRGQRQCTVWMVYSGWTIQSLDSSVVGDNYFFFSVKRRTSKFERRNSKFESNLTSRIFKLAAYQVLPSLKWQYKGNSLYFCCCCCDDHQWLRYSFRILFIGLIKRTINLTFPFPEHSRYLYTG